VVQTLEWWLFIDLDLILGKLRSIQGKIPAIRIGKVWRFDKMVKKIIF